MLSPYAIEPLAAYRAHETERALELAAQVLARDPNSAQALWVQAIVAVRQNRGQEASRALRNLLRVRSPDWILAALYEDFNRFGEAKLGTETGFALGNFLRSKLEILGPALPTEERRASHDFINVVGTSYARGFGGNTAFFPLFIGTGATILNLTEEAGALARAKFKANLARVDPARNTMLVLGGDPFCHIANTIKTRPFDSPELYDEDYAYMDRAAARHEGILKDALATITGRVMLLGATPQAHAIMSTLARYQNSRLRPICERLGVTFLDWWDDLVDPETGILQARYCANSMVNDPHFSFATNELFVGILKREGLLPETVETQSDYDWTHVFECEVEKSERTRIWCEPTVTPNNAFNSPKIAASYLCGRLADLACLFLLGRPDKKVAMVNVRDGLLPVAIAAQLHSGAVAFTETRDNARVAQAVLDFFGRTDVELRFWCEDTLAEIDGAAFDLTLVEILPDTIDQDEARCVEFLRRTKPGSTVLVMTADIDRFAQLDLSGRKLLNQFQIANNHLLPQWRQTNIAIVR